MRGAISEQRIAEELRGADPVPVIFARSATYPYFNLDARRFEILSWALLDADAKANAGNDFWYDRTHLLVEGPDGARDIMLYKDGALTGVVQCKRLSRRLELSAVTNELLRYCLFAAIEGQGPGSMRYQLWTAVGLNNDAGRFFHDSEFRAEHIRGLTSKDVSRARGKTKGLQPPADAGETLWQAEQALKIAAALNLSWVGADEIDVRLSQHTHIRDMFFSVPEKQRSVGNGAAAASTETQPPRTFRRIAAVPPHSPRPRPVNLLMVLGVDRRPGIAVTLGADPDQLLHALSATDHLVSRSGLSGTSPREWLMRGSLRWHERDGAGGLVWPVANGAAPPIVEIVETLAVAFRVPRPACGDVVVFALPEDAGPAADEIVETIAKLGRLRAVAVGCAHVPVQVWRSGATRLPPRDRLLTRLLNSLDPDAPHDRNADLERARRMRLAGRVTADFLRETSAESLRLYDMAVVAAGEADRAATAEDEHAAMLLAEAPSNPHLLHGIGFMSVSAAVLQALAKAPRLTRAVAGLLTADEMHAPRPRWQPHLVDGYRAAGVADYLVGGEIAV